MGTKLTSAASESNALVTIKSGQEISLQLVAGKGAVNARVDFVVEYHRRRSMLVAAEAQNFAITEAQPPRGDRCSGIGAT